MHFTVNGLFRHRSLQKFYRAFAFKFSTLENCRRSFARYSFHSQKVNRRNVHVIRIDFAQNSGVLQRILHKNWGGGGGGGSMSTVNRLDYNFKDNNWFAFYN